MRNLVNRKTLLGTVIVLTSTSLTANATAGPVAASAVNCTTASCGLYLDVSGSASAGTAETFSYQPSWISTNSRSVMDGAQGATAANGATAAVTVSDFVTFGAIKSTLISSAIGGGTPGLPYAGADAYSILRFSDRLTFTGQPANTLGTMVGRMAFSGSVSASAATNIGGGSFSYGYATAEASVPGQTATVFDRSDDTLGPVYIDPSNPNYLIFSLPIKFGAVDFTLLYASLYTTVRSNALTSFWANSSADFSSSLDWEGIDKVMDSNGNTLAGWQVSSASGFDYSRSYASQVSSVPEPDTYAMLLAGLGLVGFAARRKAA